MSIDLKIYFETVRGSLFGGSMNQNQVSGQEKIIQYREEEYPHVTNDQLAYMLATTKWETAHTMQPIKEYGSLGYLKSKPYYPWYGRGLVQLTWDYNYAKYGIKDSPDKALDWGVALNVLFDGMIKGIFTGKKLGDYITEDKCDYVSARRIINGTDKAKEIAAIAENFRDALNKSEIKEPDAPDDSFKSQLLSLLKTDKDVQDAVKEIVRG